MSTILDQICEKKRVELEVLKADVPFAEMCSRASRAEARASFKAALMYSKDNPSVIAELKKASPSAGLIRANFLPLQLAKNLEENGASALSVLTERNYFQGCIGYLRDVAKIVEIPLLRKDFIFDAYQIAEAKANGASAVLLIAAMLEKSKFAELYNFAKSLSLDILAEAHDAREIEMLADCGADIVGVNCRNLKNFSTDFDATAKLLKLIPNGTVKVAESAINSREKLLRARDAGADAVLIGTALMSKESPSQELKKLLGNI